MRPLYMIIEHFRDGDAAAVYRRFRERGRLAPEGLTYVSSWVDTALERCYQVMETADRRLLDEWIEQWRDLVDFEVHPVLTSEAAAERALPRPGSGRPAPGEYAAYAQADIDAVAGDDVVTILESLGADTLAFFRGLPESSLVDLRYAPDKWTIKDVVAHLVDDERIFAYRALCVARGETQALPGFDEKVYAAHAGGERRRWPDLLDEYAVVRPATVALFRSMPAEALTRVGTVNGYPASPRGLGFHIAAHELHHLRIIRDRYLPAVCV